MQPNVSSAFISTAVDIHAHVVPSPFPRSLHRVAGWPSMEPADACHGNIVIDGKVYRTLSDKCWEVPKRLVDRDAIGVALQAVLPMPERFSFDTRVMVGTDFPFNFYDRGPVERILQAVQDDAVRTRLLHTNARQFLNLESQP
jgi:hypothetical protein